MSRYFCCSPLTLAIRVDACASLAAAVVIRVVRLASVCVCSGSPAGAPTRTALTVPSTVTTSQCATACHASNAIALCAPIGARNTSRSLPPISAANISSAPTTKACSKAS